MGTGWKPLDPSRSDRLAEPRAQVHHAAQLAAAGAASLAAPREDSSHKAFTYVPYWYVQPDPYPEPAALPAWTGPGRWHTDEWVGLVLSARDLAAAGGDPLKTLRAFQDRGIEACKATILAW